MWEKGEQRCSILVGMGMPCWWHSVTSHLCPLWTYFKVTVNKNLAITSDIGCPGPVGHVCGVVGNSSCFSDLPPWSQGVGFRIKGSIRQMETFSSDGLTYLWGRAGHPLASLSRVIFTAALVMAAPLGKSSAQGRGQDIRPNQDPHLSGPSTVVSSSVHVLPSAPGLESQLCPPALLLVGLGVWH